MPEVFPFKAILPKKTSREHFPVNNISGYSEEELSELIHSDNLSFINLLSILSKQVPTEKRFKQIRDNFISQLEDGHLEKSQEKKLYILEIQYPDSFKFRGIIGLISLDHYRDKAIKTHENTLIKREILFSNYLKKVKIQAEPVLLSYPTISQVQKLITDKVQEPSTLEITFQEDKVCYKLWEINDVENQNLNHFFKNQDFYIADGHHRMASTYRHAIETKGDFLHSNELSSYILSYIISEEDLAIFEYNRLIKDVSELSKGQFMKMLRQFFEIEKHGEKYQPVKSGSIGMYFKESFYQLNPKKEILQKLNPVLGKVDTYIFEELILKPILGIKDSRNDKRIKPVPGDRTKQSIKSLKEKVDGGEYKLAFYFHRLSFEAIKEVSDNNMTLPPKSTFIHPKIKSGFMMYGM